MKASENAALLIRKIMDGKGTAVTRRNLVAIGGPAVEPVLGALVGDHGGTNPEHTEKATNELVKVLVNIAKDDPKPLAGAMAHHQPGLNIVVWALGHSSSRHAQGILKGLTNHEDPAVADVAEHHLKRHAEKRRKQRKRKKPAARKKPTTPKKTRP